MAAEIASTRIESSKIDCAGVESGAKMLVGLIANAPPWLACRVLFARPVPGSLSLVFANEPRWTAAQDASTVRHPGARVGDPGGGVQGAFAICVASATEWAICCPNFTTALCIAPTSAMQR